MKKSELRNIIKEEIQHIFEEAKDDMRINDIVRKAANDERKMLQLAQTMANKITDGLKAVRRAEAAEKIIPQSGVAQIFRNRAKQLGLDVGGAKNVVDTSSGKGYIFLPTWSALALWDHEITGQLSDGAWENSTPHNHWEFWSDLESKHGAPEVKGGGYARRTGYNLNVLIEYVGERMLNLGRFGKAVARKLNDNERYGAEYLPEKEEDLASIKGYQQEYIKKLRKGDIKKFYATQYSQTDLNNDLKYIKKAMSTART